MATPSTLWSLSRRSEESSPSTPSWYEARFNHLGRQLYDVLGDLYLMLLGLMLSVLQAGNVVTGEMVEELILSGADIIKVGIGPGGWARVCVRASEEGDPSE